MNQQLAQPKILIVDDVPENLDLLATILSKQGYKVHCANNGSRALMEARNDLPNLILLDINMPDLDGYQVCQQLKAGVKTKSIPVIFLNAPDNTQDQVKGFNLGGVDFISKPFQVEEVLARVRNQLELQAAYAKINTLNQEIEQRVQERTAHIESANRVLRQEILQHHQLEQKLRHEALHDSLTGLPNRSLFMHQIHRCLNAAIDDLDYQFALLFIDLDRFKIINDSLGHLAGDELLNACAQRLQNCVLESGMIARLGGDEFTVLLENIQDIQDAIAVAEQIIREFAIPFDLGNRNLLITASIGIAIGNSQYRQEIDLLRDADTALYRAKELGKARYELFNPQMYVDAMRRLELENALREAIAKDLLVVYYQPILTLKQKTLIGFEALVRWQHPEQGLVLPEEFMSLAKETGLIVSLGTWVMEQACLQLKSWQESFPKLAALTMSINVAGEQLYNPQFLWILDRIITETQVDCSRLKFEIVESTLIEDTAKVITVLQQIKDRQIRLSIDDFGTGYSSLSYLPQFPLDILKIDRSFVEQMDHEQQNREIIKTIITLAQVLDLQIIAEGIANETQFNTLKALGVDFGQGFWLGKPLTAQLATDLIAEQLP